MSKKILIVSILAAFIMVAISFASALQTTSAQNTRKESPLFRIRIRLAIGEMLEKIKAKYIGQRLFFLPFIILRNEKSPSVRDRLMGKTLGMLHALLHLVIRIAHFLQCV